MNSLFRLRLQVEIKGIQQFAQLQRQMKSMQTAVNQASRASSGSSGSGGSSSSTRGPAGSDGGDPDAWFHAWNRSLIGVGKQIQWTGRQLEYNFTLPIMRAGKAIIAMGTANEAAQTKLIKVYPELVGQTEKLSQNFLSMGQNGAAVNRDALTPMQLTAYDLGKAFRALSDTFGTSIDQVSEIASMWAATGAVGADLAVSVRNTMEAMAVGDFTDSEDAFQTLVQVQAAYGLSVTETTKAMAIMNAVENVTAAQFGDLAKVVARAGATARTAGVSLMELTALASALVPATGSAETAGNALKTMFSRILVPTKDAAELFEKVGINTESAAWQSQTATERLTTLAGAYKDLTQPQKAVIDAYVAGRYQLNRFDAIMAALVGDTEEYTKALAALSGGLDENGQVMTTYREELQTLLASNPKAMEILTTRIKNVANELVITLFPAIIFALRLVERLAHKFSELSPAQKQIIVMAALFLAAIGPIMRVGGAVLQLVGIFGKVGTSILLIPVKIARFVGAIGAGIFKAIKFVWLFIGKVSGAIETFLGGLAWIYSIPVWAVVAIITAVLAAIIGLLWVFRDKASEPVNSFAEKFKLTFQAIGTFFHTVFSSFPVPVKNAMKAVLSIVLSAAKAVYNALQWMNPFAHHSPSLVEQVQAGVDLIAAKYATLSNVGQSFRKAVDDLNAFKDATAEAVAAQGAGQRGEQRADVALVAPEALPQFDVMANTYDQLVAALNTTKAVMNTQQAIVNGLQSQYDALGRSIDVAESIMKGLTATTDALDEQLTAANDAIKNFADTPIEGMREMEDQIFANSMAQKQLQLQLMNMEDAVGPIDDLADRLARLAGEIEQLQGMQTDLRKAGAGSEITGPIQAQIDALEGQRDAIKGQTAPMEELQKQIDALDRAGQKLDLENSLKFDPLLRQIDQLANGIKELPFATIIAGITEQQNKIPGLTAAYDQASAAVRNQQLSIDSLNASQNAVNTTLDVEKQKLDDINTAYQAIEDQIGAMDDAFNALSAAASAARKALDEASQGNAADQFDAGALGTFDEGDLGAPTFDGSSGDLEKLANDWAEQADHMFDGLDPFKSIRDKWDALVGWWNEVLVPAAKTLWSTLGDIWGGGDGGGGGIGGAVQTARDFWVSLKDTLDAILGSGVVDSLKTAFSYLWDAVNSPLVATAAQAFWDTLKQDFEAVKGFVVDTASAFLDKLTPAWKATKKALVPMVEAFGHLLNVLGPLAVAVGVFVAMFVVGLGKLIAFGATVFKPFFVGLFGWFGSIVNAIIEIVAGLVAFVLNIINGDWGKAWTSFLDVVKGVWDLFYAFVLDMPLALLRWIGDAALWLLETGADIILGLMNGIDSVIGTVSGFFGSLLSSVLGWIGNTLGWLWNRGNDLLTGLWNGIDSGVSVIVSFFNGLDDAILGWIGETLSWLWNRGNDLLTGLWNGIDTASRVVSGFFIGLGAAILGYVGNFATTLWASGYALLLGLLNGIGAGVQWVWGFFGGIATSIGNFFLNAGSWLRDAGIAIIQGLANGMEEATQGPLGKTLNFISLYIGMHKGPPSYDKVMLTPHGEWIMQGLINGIRSRLPTLQEELQGVTDLVNRGAMNVEMAAKVDVPAHNQGPKVLVFNGDLTLPNITSGEDADLFIRNLEALAAR